MDAPQANQPERPAGPVQQRIQAKLDQAFAPAELQVLNESYMHNVPEGSESHFKVVVISTRFDGERLVARHRAVTTTLADELAGPVHALSIEAHTPDEWQAKGHSIAPSPVCLGGSKADGGV